MRLQDAVAHELDGERELRRRGGDVRFKQIYIYIIIFTLYKYLLLSVSFHGPERELRRRRGDARRIGATEQRSMLLCII